MRANRNCKKAKQWRCHAAGTDMLSNSRGNQSFVVTDARPNRNLVYT